MTTDRLVAVGSYTASYGAFRAEGEGVTFLRFDPTNGRLATDGLINGLVNPAWLTVRADELHVVCETDATRSCIATIDPATRSVTARRSVPGELPCHVALHPRGRWAACPCYGSGDAFIFGLTGTSQTSLPHAHLHHAGRGPHPVRQTQPHPHACLFSPDGHWLLIPDLGTDEIWIYAFDANSGVPRLSARHSLSPGSGPRLALFSPEGTHVLLVLELASAVVSLRWDNGRLHEVAGHSGLFASHDGENTSAGIRWHPNGEYFAVSNRGANRIAVFSYDDGLILPIAEVGSGGIKPRDFAFSPCGRWLVVANQDSDTLVVFSVDLVAGNLTQAGVVHNVRSPSCIRFLPE